MVDGGKIVTTALPALLPAPLVSSIPALAFLKRGQSQGIIMTTPLSPFPSSSSSPQTPPSVFPAAAPVVPLLHFTI